MTYNSERRDYMPLGVLVHLWIMTGILEMVQSEILARVLYYLRFFLFDVSDKAKSTNCNSKDLSEMSTIRD
jgi:hypothetical protein